MDDIPRQIIIIGMDDVGSIPVVLMVAITSKPFEDAQVVMVRALMPFKSARNPVLPSH